MSKKNEDLCLVEKRPKFGLCAVWKKRWDLAMKLCGHRGTNRPEVWDNSVRSVPRDRRRVDSTTCKNSYSRGRTERCAIAIKLRGAARLVRLCVGVWKRGREGVFLIILKRVQVWKGQMHEQRSSKALWFKLISF